MSRDYSLDWAFALQKAQAQGAIKELFPLDAGAWSARPGKTLRGWDDAARIVAGWVTGGTVSPGANGLSWRVGSNWAGSLVHTDDVEAVTDARRTVGELLPPGDPCGIDRAALESCWSVGRAALLIWRWVGEEDTPPKRPYSTTGDKLLYPVPKGASEPPNLAHEECTPGLYPAGWLWDVKDAYPNLLKRVSEGKDFSLRPRVWKAGKVPGIDWGTWREGERDRLIDALQATWKNYTLARALWGCALGSYDWHTSYTPTGNGNAKACNYRNEGGPFRELALVISATMRDLCCEQCEQAGAVYGTVDSVLCTAKGFKPRLWEQHGLYARVKRAGSWDLRGRGVWGVWRQGLPKPETMDSSDWIDATEPYKRGTTYQEPIVRPQGATKLYSVWLQ